MFSNEELYATLTWTQLLIGLVIGFAPIAVTIAVKCVLYNRCAAKTDNARRLGGNEADRVVVSEKEVTSASEKAVTVLRGAYYILGVLTVHRQPVFFWTIIREVHAAQKAHKDWAVLSAASIRSILERLQEPGDIRLNGDGFVITERGRELYKQIVRINGPLSPRGEVWAIRRTASIRRDGQKCVDPTGPLQSAR